MIFTVKGNMFRIYYSANELAQGNVTVYLPKGYSYKTILIIENKNVAEVNDYMPIILGVDYTFPIVNSSSPSTLSLYIPSTKEESEITFIIKEFGQIPNPNYFDKAFEPILVTGGDGKEYNVIPSDQFK